VASRVPATFFEHQARSRRATSRLVVLFLLAVAGVTLAVNLVVATAYSNTVGRYPLPQFDAVGNLVLTYASVPRTLYLWTTLVTLAVIGLRSLVVIRRLRTGGDVVALMAGGRFVDRGTKDPDERRLLNVVDEMAIASGVAVPRAYVLRGEPGINAFAAGYAPNQAAIAVTEGALRRLTRDELQGVIGHEYSHVLNGDMRLNVQMIGVLAGILFLGEIGEFLMRSSADRGSRRSGVVLLGLAITIIGYVGLFFGRLIKAGVSRQREFLADASSVQFTRNPDGLAGALARIGGIGEGSLVRNRHAETLSHMFFANGISVWFASLFATHPPLGERIRRINPRFIAARYFAMREQAARAPAAAAAPGATSADRRREPVTPVPPPDRTRPAPPRVSGPAVAVVASVGKPDARHLEHAARLLESLPVPMREAANTAEGAQAVILAFALSPEEVARKAQLDLLSRAGAGALARQANTLAGHVGALAPAYRLPVVAIALPALHRLPQPARDGLVRHLQALAEADRRVTLEEFVLLTIVRQHMRPGAARNEPVEYRSILEVLDDARLVVSLLAHAGGGDAQAAFERGFGALGLDGRVAVPLAEIAFPRVAAALDRLRRLAPFVKRNFVTACVETATQDSSIALAVAELLRAVATALDCPVPPILEAIDGAAFA
jgi:Zn-dependent protease with chaperone function